MGMVELFVLGVSAITSRSCHLLLVILQTEGMRKM